MNRTRLSRNRLVGIAVAAALLIAGCGSDAETESSTAADSQVGGSTATSTVVTGTDVTSTEALVESDYLGSYTLADETFGTMVTVTVDGDTRTIETNALPDHETGDFPNGGNPNTISEQDLTWEFTTNPTFIGNASSARTSGVAVNGVKFEPGTAETVSCESGENYRIEALQEIYDLGLDFNNAHVQPTGEYHYHGVSELLVDAYDSDDDLVMVGFASDGFLMYYSKSGAYDSGYSLTSAARTGTDCLVSGPAGTTLDLDGTSPDGVYTSDWVFDEDTGDLDSCNGTTIDGQYAYIITDAYPYVSRCLNGEVSAAAGGGGGGAPGGNGAAPGGDDAAGNGAAPGNGGGPDLTDAAATLGVSVDELMAALGGPPPDFDAAAETLGVTVDELTAALPTPDQGLGGPPPGEDN